jgi:hypothetical protein
MMKARVTAMKAPVTAMKATAATRGGRGSQPKRKQRDERGGIIFLSIPHLLEPLFSLSVLGRSRFCSRQNKTRGQ